MKQDLKQMRSQYLKLTKDLVSTVMKRQSHLSSELCPACYHNPIEERKALKAVAVLNRQASEICDRMRVMETNARGAIGIPAVFKQDVPNVIRIAVAFLAGKSLSASLYQETRTVAALCEMAGGNAPDEMLLLREAMVRSGVLRPHIHCTAGRTIDELENLTLTENAFRKLLSLEPDSEMADIVASQSMVRRRL